MKKKILLLVVAAATLVFTGCKKEETKNDNGSGSGSGGGGDNPPSSAYVDLGLPSGTRWKISNEINSKDTTEFFTWDEAVAEFGKSLPTKEQLEELKDKCTWSWTVSGYKVTGLNGNSIVLPASGYRG